MLVVNQKIKQKSSKKKKKEQLHKSILVAVKYTQKCILHLQIPPIQIEFTGPRPIIEKRFSCKKQKKTNYNQISKCSVCLRDPKVMNSKDLVLELHMRSTKSIE